MKHNRVKMNSQKSDKRFSMSAVVAAVLVLSSLAGAAEVDLQLSTREVYVGVGMYAQISIRNASTHQSPVFPDIPGVTIRPRGPVNRSSKTTIINGKMTQSKSVTYVYELTPKKVGTFTIPKIEVKADGQAFSTQPLEFIAVKSVTSELLFVEIVGNRDKVYIGEELDLTLRIWIRPFQDRSIPYTLRESDMWRQVMGSRSKWGIFRKPLEELDRKGQRLRGREVLRKDSEGNQRSYYLYEVESKTWPTKPGKIDGSDVEVRLNYPTGLRRSNGSFPYGSSLRISGARPLARNAKVDNISVLPIPSADRPVQYRGAVGRFDITASALPKDVYTGDPITLTLTARCTGSGRLDLLQAPPLADMPQLNRNFKVPEESLAGVVKGNTKKFTISLRAKNEKVTEIPSIPLVFFDPRLGKFGTARTEPIPITVKPVDKFAMDRIVSAAGAGGQFKGELTEQAEGINANVIGLKVLQASSPILTRWSFWTVLAAGPMLFAGLFTGKLWLAGRADPAQARNRTARKNALRRLNVAAGPDEVAATLIQYVADRLEAIAVGMTRADVVDKLRQRSLPEETIQQTDQLLRRCEEHLYSGNSQQHIAELATQVRVCMNQLENEIG